MYDLPVDEGRVWYNWSLENDVACLLGGIKRDSKGYIGQEIERLLAMVKHESPH